MADNPAIVPAARPLTMLSPNSASALHPKPAARGEGALPQEASKPVIVLICATVAALLASTALTNLMALLMCAAAVFYWIRFRPFWLLRTPVSMLCFAFLGWMALRDAAAGASAAEIATQLNDFRPLLFLVLWAPLFAAAAHRRAALVAFFCGMTVFAFAAIGSILLTGRPVMDFFRRGHDLAGPLMAFAIVATAQLAIAGGRWRRAWIAFAVLASCTLFFATIRRTGYVGFGVGMAVLAALNLGRPRPRTLGALALLVVLPAALLLGSGAARHRMAQVVSEVKAFAATDVTRQKDVRTSSGLRLRFWTVTVEVIKESPLAGSSLSRFRERYDFHDARLGGSAEATGNPHNEYLYVLGALGAVGLAGYLAIYAGIALRVRRFGRTQRNIAWLALVTFLVSILYNSLLIDMVPGHFFVLSLLCLIWYPWPDAGGKDDPA